MKVIYFKQFATFRLINALKLIKELGVVLRTLGQNPTVKLSLMFRMSFILVAACITILSIRFDKNDKPRFIFVQLQMLEPVYVMG